MAGREDASSDATLHGNRELQQADHIGDHRPRASETGGQFLVGDVELLKKLLIRGRFFQRVELCAMDVFEESVAQHVAVGRLANDRWDRLESGFLTRSPAPLAHDDLVEHAVGCRGGELTHDDRLHEPELFDRVHEFGHRLFVEDAAWLVRVRLDECGGQLAIDGPDFVDGADGRRVSVSARLCRIGRRRRGALRTSVRGGGGGAVPARTTTGVALADHHIGGSSAESGSARLVLGWSGRDEGCQTAAESSASLGVSLTHCCPLERSVVEENSSFARMASSRAASR